MRLNFLTPSAERLHADGRFEPVHPGGALGRLRPPIVLLSRELCTFSLFEASGLPKGRRLAAARLYARSATAYLATGSAISPSGEDFAIWWWDAEDVAAKTSDRYGRVRVTIRPETLGEPRGVDWRIVRLSNGYDAQLWRKGGLKASYWRQSRFDTAAWTAFTRLQRQAVDAPAEPPAPQVLPLLLDSEAFAFDRVVLTRQQAMIAAISGFALVACCFVAFSLGQGLVLSRDRAALEAETASIRAVTPAQATTQMAKADREKLVAYQAIEAQTNPLSAAGAAIGTLTLYDMSPRSLDADQDKVTITLPYGALDEAQSLVTEFEASGYFENVEPRTDQANDTVTFEMTVKPAAPPLTVGE